VDFRPQLMNAAILGYLLGNSRGTGALCAYYGSFLTGGFIVGRLRQNGACSLQGLVGGTLFWRSRRLLISVDSPCGSCRGICELVVAGTDL